jgi:hypothetical protein
MAFKKRFNIFILFFILFANILLATSQQLSPEKAAELALIQASPWLYALIVGMAAFIGIVYMLGQFLHNEYFIFYAKKEAKQLFLTFILLLLYTSVIFFTNLILFNALGLEKSEQGKDLLIRMLKDKETSIISAVRVLNQKQHEYLINGITITPGMFLDLNPGRTVAMASLDFSDIVATCAAAANIAGATCAALSAGLGYGPCYKVAFLLCTLIASINHLLSLPLTFIGSFSMATNYDLVVRANMLEPLAQTYARLAENSLVPLRIMVQFYFFSVFPLLPVMAILLRLIPFTRPAGNLIYTISIAFGAVFIFVLTYLYIAYEGLGKASGGKGGVVQIICGDDALKRAFEFGPFDRCDADYNIPKLISYIPFITVIPYIAFSISLTFAQSFNKIFDYFSD